MRSFCLKKGRGLRPSAGHLYTNFLWAPLPIPSPPPAPAGFLALHAYVRSIRSSSRVLQMKVILLTIRWEILYVQTWQRQLPLKEYGCSHLWQTLSRVTFLLCECARLKCVHWKIQSLGWIWGKGLLKFGEGWFGSPLKFIIGSEAWGIRQKIVLFTAQPQDDFIFLLFPKCRSQICILIYRNWSIC